MDIYEEGEYTPVLTAGTTGLTLDTAVDTLAYTKIGRQVSVQGQIKLNDTRDNGVSENLTLSLPFTLQNLTDESEQFTASVGYVDLATLGTSTLRIFGPTGSVAYFVEQTDVEQVFGVASHVVDNTLLYLSFTYFTDA